MNTIENKKLMAEFLGYDILLGSKIISVIKHNQLKVFNPNSNWNWLMEIVEKIERLGYVVNITGISCSVAEILNDKPIINFVLGDKSNKIKLVNITLIEFINWYKQQK